MALIVHQLQNDVLEITFYDKNNLGVSKLD